MRELIVTLFSQLHPFDLDQFMRLVENLYSYPRNPKQEDVLSFLALVIEQVDYAFDENDWKYRIQLCVERWLVA
jgi:hypothetical protein